MSLWEYANPRRFLGLSERVLPGLSVLALLLLVVGLIWGFFYSPDDYRMGSTVKIIYLHVPSALMAINAWLMMLVASLVWLIRRHHVSALAAKAAAPVGAVMTVIALITGAIWGQPMWGTWWVWDARLTSVLVLFFLYLGFIALANAFDDAARGEKASAILALVGAVNLPIIKFSVDWWNTLHQPASVTKIGMPAVHSSMLIPLLLMAVGFTMLFVVLVIVRARAELADRRINALRSARIHAETAQSVA